MKGIKIFGYVLLAFLFVATVPYAAEAGSVKIRAHQFKPNNPSDTHNFQDPWAVRGEGGEAEYHAVVNLPVGKRITRLVLYHSSGTGANGTDCYLYRVRWGVGDILDKVAQCWAWENTGGLAVARSTTIIDYPKVKAGFTYCVYLIVGDDNCVHGVKVVYE